MTRYLFDANAVITLLNNPNSPLARRARQHTPAEIHISSIVAHELFYGAFKSRRAERNVTLGAVDVSYDAAPAAPGYIF